MSIMDNGATVAASGSRLSPNFRPSFETCTLTVLNAVAAVAGPWRTQVYRSPNIGYFRQ
jgi:hypothetical protein